jgi:hypothetical protein
MALFDLDLYFVDLFATFLNGLKDNLHGGVLDDVFAMRPDEERARIAQFLTCTTFTKDVRERGEGERVVVIIPSLPTTMIPFPQVAVYLGEETSAGWSMGERADDSARPVTREGETLAWDYTYGYFAGVTCRIDILAGSREEVLWLTRLCHRALLGQTLALDALGVKEPAISLSDLQIEQQQMPALVFGRRVTYAAKVLQTWIERKPVGCYETGVNKALAGLTTVNGGY